MGVWDFIQDQVLGMKWLNELLGIGLSALGLDVNGRIGGSVQFFIYDGLRELPPWYCAPGSLFFPYHTPKGH